MTHESLLVLNEALKGLRTRVTKLDRSEDQGKDFVLCLHKFLIQSKKYFDEYPATGHSESIYIGNCFTLLKFASAKRDFFLNSLSGYKTDYTYWPSLPNIFDLFDQLDELKKYWNIRKTSIDDCEIIDAFLTTCEPIFKSYEVSRCFFLDQTVQVFIKFCRLCELTIENIIEYLERLSFNPSEVCSFILRVIEEPSNEELRGLCLYSQQKAESSDRLLLLDKIYRLDKAPDGKPSSREFGYFNAALGFMNYVLTIQCNAGDDEALTYLAALADKFSKQKMLMTLLNKSQLTPWLKNPLLLRHFNKNSEFLRMSLETLNCYRQLIGGSSDAEDHDEEKYEGKSEGPPSLVLPGGGAVSKTSPRGKVGGEEQCDVEPSKLPARIKADVQRLLAYASNLCELDWGVLKPEVTFILSHHATIFSNQSEEYSRILEGMKTSCSARCNDAGLLYTESNPPESTAILCYAEAFILDLLLDLNALTNNPLSDLSTDKWCEAILMSNGLMHIPRNSNQFSAQGENQHELIPRLTKYLQQIPWDSKYIQRVYEDLNVNKMIGIIMKPWDEEKFYRKVNKIFPKISGNLNGKKLFEQCFWSQVMVLKECLGGIIKAKAEAEADAKAEAKAEAEKNIEIFRKILKFFFIEFIGPPPGEPHPRYPNDYLLQAVAFICGEESIIVEDDTLLPMLLFNIMHSTGYKKFQALDGKCDTKIIEQIFECLAGLISDDKFELTQQQQYLALLQASVFMITGKIRSFKIPASLMKGDISIICQTIMSYPQYFNPEFRGFFSLGGNVASEMLDLYSQIYGGDFVERYHAQYEAVGLVEGGPVPGSSGGRAPSPISLVRIEQSVRSLSPINSDLSGVSSLSETIQNKIEIAQGIDGGDEFIKSLAGFSNGLKKFIILWKEKNLVWQTMKELSIGFKEDRASFTAKSYIQFQSLQDNLSKILEKVEALEECICNPLFVSTGIVVIFEEFKEAIKSQPTIELGDCSSAALKNNIASLTLEETKQGLVNGFLKAIVIDDKINLYDLFEGLYKNKIIETIVLSGSIAKRLFDALAGDNLFEGVIKSIEESDEGDIDFLVMLKKGIGMENYQETLSDVFGGAMRCQFAPLLDGEAFKVSPQEAKISKSVDITACLHGADPATLYDGLHGCVKLVLWGGSHIKAERGGQVMYFEHPMALSLARFVQVLNDKLKDSGEGIQVLYMNPKAQEAVGRLSKCLGKSEQKIVVIQPEIFETLRDQSPRSADRMVSRSELKNIRSTEDLMLKPTPEHIAMLKSSLKETYDKMSGMPAMEYIYLSDLVAFHETRPSRSAAAVCIQRFWRESRKVDPEEKRPSVGDEEKSVEVSTAARGLLGPQGSAYAGN